MLHFFHQFQNVPTLMPSCVPFFIPQSLLIFPRRDTVLVVLWIPNLENPPYFHPYFTKSIHDLAISLKKNHYHYLSIIYPSSIHYLSIFFWNSHGKAPSDGRPTRTRTAVARRFAVAPARPGSRESIVASTGLLEDNAGAKHII